jgi:hypothetical protein
MGKRMERDSGGKNKIIAISIVRNESRRYLRKWLDNVKTYAGLSIILDDASADETPQIIADNIKSGYPGILFKRETSLFSSNEPKLRAELWEHVRRYARAGDIIWVVDADEFYFENWPLLIPFLFFALTRYHFIKVKCLDFWTKNQYRTDGLWSPKMYRIFRFIDVPFNEITDKLHTRPFPDGIDTKSYFSSDIQMCHYGYIDDNYKRKKYDFYKNHVNQSDNPAMYKHALSIMDVSPNLKNVHRCRGPEIFVYYLKVLLDTVFRHYKIR